MCETGDMLLLAKLGQLLCLRTRLGFGETATGYFHFRNIETEDMVVYQSNLVGVELFFYVNTSVGFMLRNLRTEI